LDDKSLRWLVISLVLIAASVLLVVAVSAGVK